MLRNVSSTLFIMVLSMLASFAVTILLGRALSISDFGEYALLRQVVLIGITIAIFGLDFSYTKIFALKTDANRKTHLLTLLFFALLSIIYVTILKFIYDFHRDKLFYLFFSTVFGATGLFVAAIQRLKGRFLLAQIFAGGWKIALLVVVLIALYLESPLRIISIYQFMLLSLFIYSSYYIKFLFQSYQKSDEEIDYRHYLKLGMVFWIINSTGLISGGIDKLVIPVFYDRDILGIFAGISFIFTTSMTMVGSAIGYVIFPKISAGQKINIRKLSLYLSILISATFILFYFTGVQLVNIVFQLKFEAYVSPFLIFLFTLIGALQIVHTILHFIISARGSNKELISYWVIMLIYILFFVLALYLGKFISIPILVYISEVLILTQILKISSILAVFKNLLREDREIINKLSTTQ
ncbi:MAG: oligosaccharide flippase family protein [Candidatus Marinimicrobia bacterium]|nr:oligosaccharide flippase family protein [Candidatus Neomarinimicrobiota bacterium]